jgi:hypothetical protein
VRICICVTVANGACIDRSVEDCFRSHRTFSCSCNEARHARRIDLLVAIVTCRSSIALSLSKDVLKGATACSRVSTSCELHCLALDVHRHSRRRIFSLRATESPVDNFFHEDDFYRTHGTQHLESQQAGALPSIRAVRYRFLAGGAAQDHTSGWGANGNSRNVLATRRREQHRLAPFAQIATECDQIRHQRATRQTYRTLSICCEVCSR